MYSPEGWSGEIGRAFRAGDREAMLNVTADLVKLQRFEVITNCDSLAEVLEVRAVEMFPEFGLAHENDLEEFAFVSLEVGEEAHLFEQFVGHVLGLIDNEDGVFLLIHQTKKKFVQEGGGFELIHFEAFDVEAEFHGDRFDQAGGVEHGVQNERCFPFRAELFEHGTADGGFARADFARELDETFSLANAVEQVVIRFTVLWTEEKEPWIWSNVEGRLA